MINIKDKHIKLNKKIDRVMFNKLELYINQFLSRIKAFKIKGFKSEGLRTKAVKTISIFSIIFLITSQSCTFAYIDIVGENLPPYATMNLSKRCAIDINIANDGTTEYSASTLNSRINEILKTKLAKEGIDYKVNIIDVEDKNIYSEQSNLKTVNFDTGKVFYPINKIGPFGADFSKISGGIKGQITYSIAPNKIIIKSYELDNEARNDSINCANDRYLAINFYSDYSKQNLIESKNITHSQIGKAKDRPNDKDNSSGGNLEIEFNSQAKCFDICVSGYFTVSSYYGGEFSYSLMEDGNIKLQWLRNLSVYSDKIKRKAFISENLTNATWRQETDKYYVDFSNREYSENTYGEGKVSSLSCLLNKNINLIKIGNIATKEDALQLINENDNNGLFIDNKDIVTAINELAEYLILKSKQTGNSLEIGSYVVVSENEIPLEFEAGGLSDKTGTQVIDTSAIRAKEYLEVNSGGTYLINENRSGIDYVNIYFYDVNFNMVNSPKKVSTNSRFSIPQNINYIKLSCQVTDIAKAKRMTMSDNAVDGGETLEYKPSVIDNENDCADIMYKFDHDNKHIAGKSITNKTEKSAFSGIELSAPIERFTKPGTYKISMYAKDIPKQIADTTNLLPNGDAELIDASGGVSGWTTWAENLSITTFGSIEDQLYKISGNASFEISTAKQQLQETNIISNSEPNAESNIESDLEWNTKSSTESSTKSNADLNTESDLKWNTQSSTKSNLKSNVKSNSVSFNNSACYYRDISVSPNTSYKLTGLLATYNCTGNLVVYEMDDNYNILKYYGSNKITSSIKNTNSNIYSNTNTNINSTEVSNYTDIVTSGNPQISSVSFTTGFSTTRLRIHIVKSEEEFDKEPTDKESISEGVINNNEIQDHIYSEEAINNTEIQDPIPNEDANKESISSMLNNNREYLFADNITLVKMLPNQLFDNYRKTSPPATTTIYAHRLPIADFTYQIENSVGAFRIINLQDNQLSYDPDHTDKKNKGIINNLWQWAEITSDGTTTWHDGKVPETQKFPIGTQVIIKYMVQDSDGLNGIGSWSKPKVISTNGSLEEPLALFVATPNPLPMQNELIITDQSYSPNYEAVIISRTWTIKKLSTGKTQTLVFDKIDSVNGKYYKKFTSLGFGQYTITLSVTDSYGKVSKPYSKTINVIDTIKPTLSVNINNGTFSEDEGAEITVECDDSTLGKIYNRGLKSIYYVWSKNSLYPQSTDTVQTINITKEGEYTKKFVTSQTQEGIWYLYVKDMDYAGNINDDDYTRFGPYTVEKIKAGNFFITMMLDIGWRAYYFDVLNGIDDNHDGISDRYPRRSNTDIGTLKMPINYYGLIGYNRKYVKAGYKVKGKIDIIGDPDYAKFNINYKKEGRTYTDSVLLTKANNNNYTFEWIIPLETDDKSFISFDLITRKGNNTYGNEKWVDTWDERNKSRLVFYVSGKATDDIIYFQSH